MQGDIPFKRPSANRLITHEPFSTQNSFPLALDIAISVILPYSYYHENPISYATFSHPFPFSS